VRSSSIQSGVSLPPQALNSVDEFSEALEVGERISRFQRRDLTANLPRRWGPVPVDLIPPHTISFFEPKRIGRMWDAAVRRGDRHEGCDNKVGRKLTLTGV
jgi:hypothetical protein